jgi:hypothetical protein
VGGGDIEAKPLSPTAHTHTSTLQQQYSEHPLVRRAATEATCNLACHPTALEHLSDPEKLKVWLALAEAYEGPEEDGNDLPTARAAAGALAMASADEGVAQALAVAGARRAGGDGDAAGGSAGRVWATLLRSGNPELVHRAAIVVRNMMRFPGPRARLQKDKALPGALAQALDGGGKSGSALPSPVRSAVEAVRDDLRIGPVTDKK